MSRCQRRIGSVTGSVTGLRSEPPVHTRASAKAGMKRATSSWSSKAPSSSSIMAATEVTGLVME